jgi:WD40 repeat protein
VACRDDRLFVYRSDSPTEPEFAVPHPALVRAVAWNPTGTHIATGCRDGLVRIVDRRLGDVVLTLAGHADQVRAVRWSEDGGRIASASADHSGGVWDVETGGEVARFFGHDEGVCDVDWSAEGDRLASAADDGWVRLWKVGPESTVLARLPGAATCASYTPEDNTLTVGVAVDDKASTVLVVDIASGSATHTEFHEPSRINSLVVTEAGTVAALGDGRIVRWRAGGEIEEFRSFNEPP